MPKLFSGLRLFVGLGILPAVSVAQTTIVSFTFEDTTTAVVGSALSAVTWNSGGAEGYTSPFSSQGQALSVNGFQIGEYYQITLDATGYSDISLNDFRSNGTTGAPKDWKISYSLTGISGVFVDATTYTLASNAAADTTTITGLSLSSGANNNSSIVLRLVATSSTRIDGTASAANGTVRLDNISFTGTAIPEPSTYAVLAGLLALSAAMLRRRRRTI